MSTLGVSNIGSVSDNPMSATGGTQTTVTQGSVTYRLHIFSSPGSSTFSVLSPGTTGVVEYLVVGGGGGSGGGGNTGWASGGGGGGGVVSGFLRLGAGDYNVTVGAGGAAGWASGDQGRRGGSGQPSSFAGKVTALGGGGGGGNPGYSEGDGGIGASGGGGATYSSAGSSGYEQGNPGGNASSSCCASGGGGGAGSSGGDASGTRGGNGGFGTPSDILGSVVYYGGGGAGAGSGGNGSASFGATAAFSNGSNGSGAGGGGVRSQGGRAGGSGTVIIKYPYVPTSSILIPPGNTLDASEGGISAPGMLIQTVYATAMPTSHLIDTNTTENTAPLTVSIRPKVASSVIQVRFFSTMYNAQNSPQSGVLYRKIGDGSYTVLTPVTATSSRYTGGWWYSNDRWASLEVIYYDAPNTTDEVTYRLNYRNYSGTGTTYLVHQYQEYGWQLMEIGQ